MKAFDEKVNQFLTKSLQLDAFTMRLERNYPYKNSAARPERAI